MSKLKLEADSQEIPKNYFTVTKVPHVEMFYQSGQFAVLLFARICDKINFHLSISLHETIGAKRLIDTSARLCIVSKTPIHHT